MKNFLVLLRVHHWVKNLLIFIPIFFGKKIFDITILIKSAFAFFIFSLAASSIYVINDILDVESDRRHPSKRHRPIASGRISVKNALITAEILMILSLILSLMLSLKLFLIIATYIALNVFYSFKLKSVAPLDVFVVSMGFLLRVYAGGTVACIPISDWLFLTVFFLALFVSVAKRRSELAILGDIATQHRASLNSYTLNFLDGLMWITASASIATYALYAVNKGGLMVFTVLPATYGIIRYLQIVVVKNADDPLSITFSDSGIISAILLFIAISIFSIYG